MAEERFRYLPACALIGAVALVAGCTSGVKATPVPPDLGPAPPERGVALGLFSADPDYRYRALLDEVAAVGATHVSLVWVWWQENLRATEVHAVDGWSATEAQVRDTVRYAKKLGLHTTVFPIVRLKVSERNEWRGRIQPTDENAWWRSYAAFINLAARVAQQEEADRLSVGSELLSREPMRQRWLNLIRGVRTAAPEVELMYSANWDHFRPVKFWDAIDVIGLTGYWELTKDLNASTATLTEAWTPILKDLAAWSAGQGRPLVLTEVGYPSLDGGAAWPWDETRQAPVDLEEQRRAYLAFIRSFAGQPWLQGVYWWNWFGFGGPEDTNYTPRGKPAAALIKAWYAQPRAASRPSR